jgi:hypothetical protein
LEKWGRTHSRSAFEALKMILETIAASIPIKKNRILQAEM